LKNKQKQKNGTNDNSANKADDQQQKEGKKNFRQLKNFPPNIFHKLRNKKTKKIQFNTNNKTLSIINKFI